VLALAVLFLLVPLLELWLIVQASAEIGFLNTVAVLIVISFVGAWLVKREGLGIMRRVQDRLAFGEVPGDELLDGFLVLMAGALLLTPGFLTDAFAVLLLLPPTRAVIRRVVRRRMRHRVEVRRFDDPFELQ
jgi:UPF0716 protein FxsA